MPGRPVIVARTTFEAVFSLLAAECIASSKDALRDFFEKWQNQNFVGTDPLTTPAGESNRATKIKTSQDTPHHGLWLLAAEQEPKN